MRQGNTLLSLSLPQLNWNWFCLYHPCRWSCVKNKPTKNSLVLMGVEEGSWDLLGLVWFAPGEGECLLVVGCSCFAGAVFRCNFFDLFRSSLLSTNRWYRFIVSPPPSRLSLTFQRTTTPNGMWITPGAGGELERHSPHKFVKWY